MPLYDHECALGHVTEMVTKYEDRTITCPICQQEARRVVSQMRRSQVDIFEGGYYEELGDDIPYISSKQQLAEECEKRGLVSRQLVEGYQTHGRRKWL